MVNIYLLKCPITKEVRYVGKTIQSLDQRLQGHLCEKKRSYKKNWINSLINKNLLPIIELIEKVDNNIWIEREKYWINYYRNIYKNLCNLTEGGEGLSGFTFSKEVRERMRLGKLGKKRGAHTKETKDKISKALDKGKNTSKINGIKLPKKTRKPSKLIKRVSQYTKEGVFIKTYTSISEAARLTFTNKSNISTCINNKAKTANKFIWKIQN